MSLTIFTKSYIKEGYWVLNTLVLLFITVVFFTLLFDKKSRSTEVIKDMLYFPSIVFRKTSSKQVQKQSSGGVLQK